MCRGRHRQAWPLEAQALRIHLLFLGLRSRGIGLRFCGCARHSGSRRGDLLLVSLGLLGLAVASLLTFRHRRSPIAPSRAATDSKLTVSASAIETLAAPALRRWQAHHRPRRQRDRAGRRSRPDGLFRLSGCIPPERTTTRTSRGALVPVLALGERSGKRDDRLLMLWSGNVQVGAGELQEHRCWGDGTKRSAVCSPSKK